MFAANAPADDDEDDEATTTNHGQSLPPAPPHRWRGQRGAGGRVGDGVGGRWGSPRLPRRRSRQGRTYSKTVSDDAATDRGAGPARPARAGVASPSPATGATPRWPDVASTTPIPAVQVAALGALARLGELTAGDVEAALGRGRSRRAPARRRGRDRGAGQGVALGAPRPRSPPPWATRTRSSSSAPPGSWASVATIPAVPRWPPTATAHDDARCREAAVAALGAIGDPAGLPAVLAALGDKPTVRRRATVALAGFDDPRVEPGAADGVAGPRLAGAPGGRGVARRVAGALPPDRA